MRHTHVGETRVMFTHSARRKSGTKAVEMNKEPVLISNWSGAVIEINVGDSTTFRSESLEIAKAFLISLEKMQVQMTSGPNRIRTGADIAYLILERENAERQPVVTKKMLLSV
jgi:hypothetical protein